MPEAKEPRQRIKRFGAPPAQPVPAIPEASAVQAEPVAPSETKPTGPKDIPPYPPADPLEEIELCGIKTTIFRREREALLRLIAENNLDLDTIGRRIIFEDGSVIKMNLASIQLNLAPSGQRIVGQLLGVFRRLDALSLQNTGITNLHGFGQVLANLFNNSGGFVRPEGGNTITGHALHMLAKSIMEEERLAELVHKPGDTIVVIAREGVPVSPAPAWPEIEIPIPLDTPSPVAAPPATTAEADGFGEHTDWLAEGETLPPDAYGPDGKRDLEASPPPIAAPRPPTPAPVPAAPRLPTPAPTPAPVAPAPVAPVPVIPPAPAPAPRPRVATPPPPIVPPAPPRIPRLPKFPSLPSIASIRALTRTRAAGIAVLLVAAGVTAYATLGNLQFDGNAVKPVPVAPPLAPPPPTPLPPPGKPSGDPTDPKPPKPAAPQTPAKPQPQKPPEAAEIDSFEQIIYFQWEKDGGLSINPSEGIDIPADSWHYRKDGRGTPRLSEVTLIKEKDGKRYKAIVNAALFGSANDNSLPQRLRFKLIP